VVIGDEIEGFAPLRQFQRGAHHTEIVADMQFPARLDARQNPHKFAKIVKAAEPCEEIIWRLRARRDGVRGPVVAEEHLLETFLLRELLHDIIEVRRPSTYTNC